MRLVPYFNKIKIWNNKKIEGIVFYYNLITREKLLSNECCGCLGKFHESLVEDDILRQYIKKFVHDVKDEDAMICDLSISMTLHLSKSTKNNISGDFLKHIDIKLPDDEIFTPTF
jgi:hypothetical protein